MCREIRCRSTSHVCAQIDEKTSFEDVFQWRMRSHDRLYFPQMLFWSVPCFFLGGGKRHDTDAHAKMPNLRTPGQYGPTALG